ncbi:Uncharacterised protein [Streptococcus pneumoniae]|nr:Uncharacterised protein [Streptococcus pneumoniae]
MSEPISKKVGTKKAAANALRFTCVILRTTKSGLKASFAPANKIPKFLYKYNVTSRNIKTFTISESETSIFSRTNLLRSIYNTASTINKIKVSSTSIPFSVLKIAAPIKETIVI